MCDNGRAELTSEQKIIRAKVGLLELAKQLGNVSQDLVLTEAQVVALENAKPRRRPTVLGDGPCGTSPRLHQAGRIRP